MRHREVQAQILNAASSLLGIALIIIAGLNVTHTTRTTFADEIAWGAALALALSCILSYLSLRHDTDWTGRWADRIFLLGMISLFGAIVVLAVGNR